MLKIDNNILAKNQQIGGSRKNLVSKERSDSTSPFQEEMSHELQKKLIFMLLNELRYRFNCQLDAWNKQYWLSRRMPWARPNPFAKVLGEFNQTYSSLEKDNIVRAQAICEGAQLFEDLSDSKDKSFSLSMMNMFFEAGIFPSSNENFVEQEADNLISDHVLKKYYDNIIIGKLKKKLIIEMTRLNQEIENNESELGLKKIPGYITMSLDDKKHYAPLYLVAKYPRLSFESTEAIGLKKSISTHSIREESDGKNKNLFAKDIRQKIITLYDPIVAASGVIANANRNAASNSSTECLKYVKSKTPSLWNWIGLESSEQKTVRLLLEEINKEKPDRVAINRRLRRLKKLKANLPASVNPVVEAIEDAFSIASNGSTIKLLSSGREEYSDLTEFKQRLDSYSTIIENDEKKNLDKFMLFSNAKDLQAYTYFIYRNNATNFNFPLAWSKEAGLSVTREQSSYATLFSNEMLDEALFTQSRSLYFTLLLICIALINATNEEYVYLQTILQSLLSSTSKAPILITESIEYMPSGNLQWLKNYIPNNILPPLEEAGSASIIQKVKTSLEKMFPVRDITLASDARTMAEKEPYSTQMIDSLTEEGLKQLVVTYAEEIQGKKLAFQANKQLMQSFENNRIGTASNQSVLLCVLLDWYVKTYKNKNKGVAFINRCFGCVKEILGLMKRDQTGSFKISLTNRTEVPAMDAPATAFTSDPRHLSQNIYHSGMFGHKISSADRLVDLIYKLFPDRMVCLGRKTLSFTSDENKSTHEISESAKTNSLSRTKIKTVRSQDALLALPDDLRTSAGGHELPGYSSRLGAHKELFHLQHWNAIEVYEVARSIIMCIIKSVFPIESGSFSGYEKLAEKYMNLDVIKNINQKFFDNFAVEPPREMMKMLTIWYVLQWFITAAPVSHVVNATIITGVQNNLKMFIKKRSAAGREPLNDLQCLQYGGGSSDSSQFLTALKDAIQEYTDNPQLEVSMKK